MTSQDLLIAVKAEVSSALQSLERVGSQLKNLGQQQTKEPPAVTGLFDSLGSVAQRFFYLQSVAQQVFGTLQQGFSALIGQNLELEKIVLSSATSLAALNQISLGGEEITNSVEAIRALQPEVEQAIDTIREGTFQLAGVTSAEVIPLFDILASQVTSLGGGLEDASQLSLKFAAGLSVLKIPLVQARQEIVSILQGTVDQNSVLAQTLGLNEQIRQYKAQGILLEELDRRLEPFLAGNQILANTFDGVTSNIAELVQEFTRLAGIPLLDPLIEQANKIYEVLLNNREQLNDLAKDIGESLASALEVAAETIDEILAGLLIAIEPIATALYQAFGDFDFAPTLSFVDNVVEGFLTLAQVVGQGLGNLIALTDVLVDLVGPTVELVTNGNTLELTVLAISAAIGGLPGLIAGLIPLTAKLAEEAANVAAGFDVGGSLDTSAAIREINSQYGDLVTTFLEGGTVSQEAIKSLRAEIYALGDQGELSAGEIAIYERGLSQMASASIEAAAAQDLTIESLQAAQQAAQQAEQAFKNANKAIGLESAQATAALEREIAERRLSDEQEIAARRLEIERATLEQKRLAAQDYLSVLLADEVGNAQKIIEIKTQISETEADLYKGIQELQEQQNQRIQDQSQAALAAKKTELDQFVGAEEQKLRALEKTAEQASRLADLTAAENDLNQARLSSQSQLLDLEISAIDARILANEYLAQAAATEQQREEIQKRILGLEQEQGLAIQSRQAIESEALKARQEAATAELVAQKSLQEIQIARVEAETKINLLKQQSLTLDLQAQVAELQRLQASEGFTAERQAQIQSLQQQILLSQQISTELRNQLGSFDQQREQLDRIFALREETLRLEQQIEQASLGDAQRKEDIAQILEEINVKVRTQAEIADEIQRKFAAINEGVGLTREEAEGLAASLLKGADAASSVSRNLDSAATQGTRLTSALRGTEAAMQGTVGAATALTGALVQSQVASENVRQTVSGIGQDLEAAKQKAEQFAAAQAAANRSLIQAAQASQGRQISTLQEILRLQIEGETNEAKKAQLQETLNALGNIDVRNKAVAVDLAKQGLLTQEKLLELKIAETQEVLRNNPSQAPINASLREEITLLQQRLELLRAANNERGKSLSGNLSDQFSVGISANIQPLNDLISRFNSAGIDTVKLREANRPSEELLKQISQKLDRPVIESVTVNQNTTTDLSQILAELARVNFSLSS